MQTPWMELSNCTPGDCSCARMRSAPCIIMMRVETNSRAMVLFSVCQVWKVCVDSFELSSDWRVCRLCVHGGLTSLVSRTMPGAVSAVASRVTTSMALNRTVLMSLTTIIVVLVAFVCWLQRALAHCQTRIEASQVQLQERKPRVQPAPLPPPSEDSDVEPRDITLGKIGRAHPVVMHVCAGFRSDSAIHISSECPRLVGAAGTTRSHSVCGICLRDAQKAG